MSVLGIHGCLTLRAFSPDEDGSGAVSRTATPPSESPRTDGRGSPPAPQFFAAVSDFADSPADDAAFQHAAFPPQLLDAPLNSLEFYPDGFGNVALQPVRRRSTRTGSNRYAPYAVRGRNSAPEVGVHAPQMQYMHMPLLPSPLPSPAQIQHPSDAHAPDAPRQQSSPPPLAQPQPLQPPALIRTRSAPAPLELLPPGLLASVGGESLSATLSEFEDAYYYGPLTPQNGFDYFELQQLPDAGVKYGMEIGPGMGLQHDLVFPGAHDDMTQYLIQGAWDGELA